MSMLPGEAPPDAVALGERIYLRMPEPMDLAAFTELVTSSQAWLSRWVTGDAAARDPDGSLWFTSTLEANAGGRSQKMFVHRLEDHRLMGGMNLNELVRGSFQNAFLGYWIGEPHAGQGYMSDALATVLRHAFGAQDLHRVEANIQPGNEASIALVRRAGFVREGFSERYLKIAGAWRDHERWALTVEAWRTRQRR